MPFSAMVIEIPLAQDGVTGSRNPVTALPSQVLEANSIRFEGGFLAKEGAQAPYTPASLGASVLNGTDWWPTSTEQRQVVLLGNGTVRKDSGAGTFPVTLATRGRRRPDSRASLSCSPAPTHPRSWPGMGRP
jgi:hypothetical protein